MRSIIVLPFALLAACASSGSQVAPLSPAVMASRYGCDQAAIVRYRKANPDPEVPGPGWTACDVLERTGTPLKVFTQTTTYGSLVEWVFSQPTERLKDVGLARQRGSWVVTNVYWGKGG